MAMTANDWRKAAIFWTEDIHRTGRVNESGQALGSLKELDANRHSFWKQVKWSVVHANLNRRIALHSLFPWQALVLA